jgi:hypothetical protein
MNFLPARVRHRRGRHEDFGEYRDPGRLIPIWVGSMDPPDRTRDPDRFPNPLRIGVGPVLRNEDSMEMDPAGARVTAYRKQ